MFIFGHRFIKSEPFYHIENIDAVLNTPSSSVVFLEFTEQNLDIIEHLNSNEILFSLSVKNITEIIYASELGGSFIVVDKTLAKTAQDIANNYLFDAKILVRIENESEIEEMALLSIDGVIFSNGIIKTVS